MSEDFTTVRQTSHSAGLKRQCLLDAAATRASPPLDADNDDSLVSYLLQTTKLLFGTDDPNLDGQKRNLSIEVYRRFDDDAIWDFVSRSLARWAHTKSDAAWFVDWRGVLTRRNSTELSAALLGHDETAVRRRGAMSCASMLDYDEVLRIKRRTRQ